MRKILLIIVAFAAFFSGCANYKNIDVTDVSISGVKFGTTTSVKLNVEVDNPSGTTFVVEDLKGTLMKEGKEFAYIVADEQVTIPKKAVTDLPVDLKVKLINPIDILALGLNYKSLDIEQFTVNAIAIIKAGKLSGKQIVIKDIPLKDIVKYMEQFNN